MNIVKVRKGIIRSLLDQDFYKFTMGQSIFRRHADVPVTFALNNRTTKIPLAEVINEDELRFNLDCYRKLRFDKTELHYLRGTNEYQDRMFCEPYLDFMGGLQIPGYDLKVTSDGQFDLKFPGPWAMATYWETPALSIVNELYTTAIMRSKSEFQQEAVYAEGQVRLAAKLKLLKQYPGLTFTDFGTRRRFSHLWQRYVVRVLKAEMPTHQFLGTSNTYLAMLNGLMPMGTSAHEMFMAYAAIYGGNGSDDGLRHSHLRMLEDWEEDYGLGLSVALTDTFGSDFFLGDFPRRMAESWKGLRHDSGDPFEFGERVIAFYQSLGINPREKMIVFSDGLDAKTIVELYKRFLGRIKVTFGWGTTLTNDLGIPTLSLVVKVIEAAGHPTVKLSDNLDKAMGPVQEIERYKRVFGYTRNERQALVV